MLTTLSRRQIVAGMGATAVVGLLTACSDSGSKDAQAQALSGETTSATPAAAAPPSSGEVDMAKLLEAGALPEKALGKEDAPVTVVEYASMTCGHCGNFHANTFPTIKEKYIDTGKVRWVLREFPFDPRAEAGFMLARCSEENYFAMVDVLFKQQANWVSVENARDALLQIARLAGFSQESFEACLTNQKLLEDIRAVRVRGAEDFAVDSTPTFFINGKKYAGAMSVDEMSAVIDGMV